MWKFTLSFTAVGNILQCTSVEISVTGSMDSEMQTASRLILLSLFICQGESVEGQKALSMRCNPPPDLHVAGQNMTIECQLDNTGLNEVCNFNEPVLCAHNKERKSCQQNNKEDASHNNKISHMTVEIYNVTSNGTYTVVASTECGEINNNIQVENVVQPTEGETESVLQPTTPAPLPAHQALTISLGCGSILVVLVLTVVLAIRKLTKKSPDQRGDPESGASEQGEPLTVKSNGT